MLCGVASEETRRESRASLQESLLGESQSRLSESLSESLGGVSGRVPSSGDVRVDLQSLQFASSTGFATDVALPAVWTTLCHRCCTGVATDVALPTVWTRFYHRCCSPCSFNSTRTVPVQYPYSTRSSTRDSTRRENVVFGDKSSISIRKLLLLLLSYRD